MKIDKTQQKQLEKEIRVIAEDAGYKIKSNSIYTIKDSEFIYCDYIVSSSGKVVYRIYIKKYAYDNIFWDIMQMSDNTKMSNSLRACGAFKAPAICLTSGKIDITDKYEEIAIYLVEQINMHCTKFLQLNDTDTYIINHDVGMYNDTLKCLANFHLNNITEAINIAQEHIDSGDVGDYINNGKGFFEWLLIFAKSL